MVKNKDKLFWGIFLMSMIIILTLTLLFLFQYTRDVALIKLSDDKIQEVDFGFQSISVINSFFNEIPQGINKLYYTIEDLKYNEIIKVGTFENIGDGNFYLTSLNFPKELDKEWKITLILKDYALRVLDTTCKKISFIQTINGRGIRENEC